MKKFLTILFCVFFNVIAFSQKNPKKPISSNDLKRQWAIAKAEASRSNPYFKNAEKIKYYGPTDNALIPNKNWENTEFAKVSRGREKSWWNPFDKGRERWSGMSYDHTLEAAKDIAEEAREYDRVVFVKGIIFWLIVFGIIGFVIYSIRKNKKDRTTSHSQKELNSKLDNLKSAYDKGLFSNDEYQQKVNTLNKEFQQKEEIENKEKIMKEKIETLNQLYKEGIISRQELDAKIFKMEQDNL